MRGVASPWVPLLSAHRGLDQLHLNLDGETSRPLRALSGLGSVKLKPVS